VARLAFREVLAAVDFLRDAVGTNAASWSSCELDEDERESTGDGRELLEEVDEAQVLRLRLGTVGICKPGRDGELLVERGDSLVSALALDGELARSSESSREAGEIGVIGMRAKRSSGAMHVGC
jgi:hypothetical protein